MISSYTKRRGVSSYGRIGGNVKEYLHLFPEVISGKNLLTQKRLIHKISLRISLVVSYKTRLTAMNVDFATPDGANYSLMPSPM